MADPAPDSVTAKLIERNLDSPKNETYQQKVTRVQKEKGHFQQKRNLGRRIQVELENMAETQNPVSKKKEFAFMCWKAGVLDAMDRVLQIVQEAKYE